VKGLVIKNTGSWYTVLTDDGQALPCKVKGNFRVRQTNLRATNPVAVGDRVSIELTADAGAQQTAFITNIEDRRNYIIRKSVNQSRQSHIIAANVDQAALVVTVDFPQTSTTFIDRFLASAEAYRVPVLLLFNKTDILGPTARELQADLINLYQSIGYQCIAISAVSGEGLSDLLPILHHRITLFSGNSGVGKSTLLNRLVPGLNLRTAEISEAHNTGMHTTTFSEMIPLPCPANDTANGSGSATTCTADSATAIGDSWLIDTPGIKGFGTFDMEPEEICGYFRDIFDVAQHCRFSNCTHTHEPGCAVEEALANGTIAPSRYESYLSMLADKDENKYREAF